MRQPDPLVLDFSFTSRLLGASRRKSASLAISAASFSASCGFSSRAARRLKRTWSTHASMVSTASASGENVPLRRSSSTCSNSCVKRPISGKPRLPAAPLMEWMARKIAFSSSGDCSPASSLRRLASAPSRPSRLSEKKLAWNCRRSIDISVHEHLVDHREEPFGRERLLDETGSSERLSLLDVLVARVAREDEDGRVLVRAEAAQGLDQVQAAHARHVHVGDHQVHALQLGELERLVAARGLGHLVADVLEHLAHDLADRGDVVDDHYSRHRPASLSPALS